jgi:hypothetical protein
MSAWLICIKELIAKEGGKVVIADINGDTAHSAAKGLSSQGVLIYNMREKHAHAHAQ